MAAKKKKPLKKSLPAEGAREKSVKKRPSKKQSGNPAVAKTDACDRSVDKKKPTKARKATTTKIAVRQNRTDSFPIVGLGASAGGLEALEEFFKNMPASSGMAFVVIMHQAAKHVSLMPELLDKCTQMDVTAIQDRMSVKKNHVYIVPPGKKVDLFNGTLLLTDLPEKHVAPLPIDHFFRSLAEECRELAVAIVLSGTGTDGTVGLSAVKGASGLAVVQSVESAKFSGMPQSALDAGLADYVMAPREMPAKLIKYARGPFLKSPPSAKTPTPDIEQALPEILHIVRRRCGHDFSGYKLSTICRRIERRMNIHQIAEPKNYCRYLDENRAEAIDLFKDLLIGVTSFFRDPEAFESLGENAIKPLLETKSDDSPWRIWVPGCASGEEAFSVAILIRELMERRRVHWNVQIFATDLNDEAIEAARLGLFPSGIANDVSAERLARWFDKEDGGYRIRKELRDWLIFAPQNVLHDPPFTKLDLICCRNLLIYLQPQMQKRLLILFHYALNPAGVLFLGTSETINEFSDLFAVVDNKNKVFRRIESDQRTDRRAHFPVIGKGKAASMDPVVAPDTQPAERMRESIFQMLAASFAPPTVVVRENGEIVHVHGRTGRYLELAPGGPPGNIVAMAREGLELDLSSALRKAARQSEPVLHDNVPVKTNGDTVLIRLVVQKVEEPKPIGGLIRISFEEHPDLPTAGEEEAASPMPRGSRVSRREKQLENELKTTRESLQRSIEELDAFNEEMQSNNEEMQSTNEELQSTNEELETSKEELHSLNEELHTVNSELQEKIRELSNANDDMNNLLNSTDIATLFLDGSLKIKRYTEQAKRIVSMIPSDMGRSLRDLTPHLQYEGLMSDAEQVLKTLIPRECEVQTEGGDWLLMRIIPYRTANDKIDGLVMTFVDIDELKRSRERATVFMEDILATVREPLLVLDADLRVRFANRSFYATFHVQENETLGQLIYDLGERQWNIAGLRKMLDDILPKNSSFEDFEVSHEFPSIGTKRMLLNARRIRSDAGEPSYILLAIEDVTG